MIRRQQEATLDFSLHYSGTNFLEFRCKTELEDYEEAVQFMRDILFNVELDETKVRNRIERIIKRYDNWKRGERGVLSAMDLDMKYDDSFPAKYTSYLRSYKVSPVKPTNERASPGGLAESKFKQMLG